MGTMDKRIVMFLFGVVLVVFAIAVGQADWVARAWYTLAGFLFGILYWNVDKKTGDITLDLLNCLIFAGGIFFIAVGLTLGHADWTAGLLSIVGGVALSLAFADRKAAIFRQR